jgi:hypothetical protein
MGQAAQQKAVREAQSGARPQSREDLLVELGLSGIGEQQDDQTEPAMTSNI